MLKPYGNPIILEWWRFSFPFDRLGNFCVFGLKQVFEQLVFLGHKRLGANNSGIDEIACAIPKPLHTVQGKTFLLFLLNNLRVDGLGGFVRRSV